MKKGGFFSLRTQSISSNSTKESPEGHPNDHPDLPPRDPPPARHDTRRAPIRRPGRCRGPHLRCARRQGIIARGVPVGPLGFTLAPTGMQSKRKEHCKEYQKIRRRKRKSQRTSYGNTQLFFWFQDDIFVP